MSYDPNKGSSPNLSALLLAGDSEELLRRSLQSLREASGLVDEIVIVDRPDRESNAVLAAQFDALLVRHQWNNCFASARNRGASQASGRWLLWLEPGETLTTEAVDSLHHWRDGQGASGISFSGTSFSGESSEIPSPNSAYWIFVERPSADDLLGGEQMAQLRLVPNRPDLQFLGRVGEQLRTSVEVAGLELASLALSIRQPIEEQAVRVARAKETLHLTELARSDSGPSAELENLRGMAFSALGLIEEASTAYRHAIDLAERGSTPMLEGYYGLLNSAPNQTDQVEREITLCLEALEIFPLDAQLLCGMGGYLLQNDRLELAARSYQLALEHGHIDPFSWHQPELRAVAAECLGRIYRLQGSPDRARAVLRQALGQFPESTRLADQLAELESNTVCAVRADAKSAPVAVVG